MKRRFLAAFASGVLAAGAVGAYASTVKYPTRFVQFKLETSSGKRTFLGKIDAFTSKCVKAAPWR